MCRINGHLWKDFNREVRNQNNHKANKSSTGRTKTIKRERNFKKKLITIFRDTVRILHLLKQEQGAMKRKRTKKELLKINKMIRKKTKSWRTKLKKSPRK